MSITKCYRFFVLSKVIKDEAYVTYYVGADLYPIFGPLGRVIKKQQLSFEEKDVVSSTHQFLSPTKESVPDCRLLNVLKMPSITVWKLPILIN